MKTNVLEWLDRTAKIFPDRTAYKDSGRSITFSELQQGVGKVGASLTGMVRTGRPAAVICGRNVYTPLAYLGVVRAGGCYAPIDGHLPVSRIEQILQTLQPEMILTDRENLQQTEQLPFSGRIMILEDLLEDQTNVQTCGDFSAGGHLESDPLYVIFTSGSSGRPKGVVTSHHSLMSYITDYAGVMDINADDVLGNQSPLDYIAAIRDIYLPLFTGCSTVIIPKELFMAPVKLFGFLDQHRITAVGWSAAALTVPVSLGAFETAAPRYLKKICFSGSVMPGRSLRIWQENLPDALFVNQYGPTEATASCTYYTVRERAEDDTVLPIGVPYPHYRVFLLDQEGKEVPPGELGEICVSGPCLALGYYNDNERTEASFIQNPLNHSYQERIYRTGDIGRQREDGLLEFHGRRDRQIKHMGHRIELDEVDLAAAGLEGVTECCSVYDQQREVLWLFYSGTASVRDVAKGLRRILPGFMVPRKITGLEKLPRLPNGKTDMNDLKERVQ